MKCLHFPHCLAEGLACNPECDQRQVNPPVVRIARETGPEGTAWTIPSEAVKMLEEGMDV